MIYHQEIIDALKASIKKWQSIVKEGWIDLGVDNCPLCKLFYPFDETDTGLCLGCPIYNKTGKSYCVNTPYSNWKGHHDEIHHFSSHLGCRFVGFRVLCDECQNLAQKELDFLRNLLREIEGQKEEK